MFVMSKALSAPCDDPAHRHARDLQAVYDVLLMISEALELQPTLERVCQAAVHLFGVDHSGLVQFDADQKLGRVTAEYPNLSTRDTLIPLCGIPIEERLLRERSPIVIEDVSAIDQAELGVVADIFRTHNIRSILIAPIISAGSVIGSFSLDWLERTGSFDNETIQLCQMFAAQVAVAIQRARLLSESRERIAALEDVRDRTLQVAAESDTVALQNMLVGQARALLNARSAGYYRYNAEQKTLALEAYMGPFPKELGRSLCLGEGIAGRLAFSEQSYYVVPDYSLAAERAGIYDHDQPFGAVIEAPLRWQNDFFGVLFVDDRVGRIFSTEDAQRLRLFSDHAALLLKNADLLASSQKTEQQLQRLLRVSATLRQVAEAIQRARTDRDIIHILLTGVTANYGLRFNRAALLLFDHHDNTLRCKMAIGHYTREAAYADWEQNPDDDQHALQTYLNTFEDGFSPEPSPFDERMRTLHMPLRDDSLLKHALNKGTIVQVGEDTITELPEAFRTRFQPGVPLVVAPLVARKESSKPWPIGVLVADNRWTEQVAEPHVFDALTSLCNAAALAIDNFRLIERSERARNQMSSLFDASRALLNSLEPRQVLEDIVHQVKREIGAEWVSALLIDGTSSTPYVADLVTTRQDHSFGVNRSIRSDGVSMRVMREGKIAKFEHTADHRDELNHAIFSEQVGAAFCFPLVLNTRSIGVMWIHCQTPRRLSRGEETALQLYVNQATLAFHNAQQREGLELLHQASEEIGKAVTWEQVAEAICAHACVVLRATFAVLWPFDSANNHFLPARARSKNIVPAVWRELLKQPPRRGSALYNVLTKQWACLEDINHMDAQADAQLRLQLEQIGAESWQAMTLQLGDDVIAVLHVYYEQPRRFTKAGRQRALTFASYVAQALKKTSLFEQVRNAHGTVTQIAKFSVMEQLDMTLRATAELLQQNFHADIVTVYAYDAEKDRLSASPVHHGATTPVAEQWSEQLPISPIVRMTLQGEDMIEIADTSRDQLFRVSRFTREERIKSCVAAPLRIGGRTVGAIFLNYREQHHLNDDEFGALGLVANQLAVAVRNEQLRRASEQRAATLDALHSGAQALLLLPSREQALKAIVEQAVNLVHERDGGGYYSVLALHNNNHLEFVAASEPGMLGNLLDAFPSGLDLMNKPVGVIGQAYLLRRTLNRYNVQTDPDFIPFIPTVTSQLAVPIELHGNVLGVLSVEHSGKRAFTEDDKQALETLARYAAITLRTSGYNTNTSDPHRVSHALTSSQLSEVRRISHGASQGASLRKVLRMACEQIDQKMRVASSIRLFNPEQNRLEFDPRWSPSFEQAEIEALKGITYQKLSEGICGWVARHRQPYKCDDITEPVRAGPDGDKPTYLELNPKPFVARCELAVPILYGADADLVGVLDVQSDQPSRFTEQDQDFLRTLADQLAVSIHMARQYDQLGAGMRSLLTWKSNLTASSAWWHSIRAYAVLIKNEAEMIRVAPPTLPDPEQAQQLSAVLGRIENHARTIVEQRVPAQLGADDQIENVRINWLVRDRIQKIQTYQHYEGVQWALELDTRHDAVVKASAEWLRHALDLLIDNAVKAVRAVSQPTITLLTRVENGSVAIYIRDNGPGIPEEYHGRLFSEQITHDGPGQGLGLLIVAVIAQTYRGEANVEQTGPNGTTMSLTFPAAP